MARRGRRREGRLVGLVCRLALQGSQEFVGIETVAHVVAAHDQVGHSQATMAPEFAFAVPVHAHVALGVGKTMLPQPRSGFSGVGAGGGGVDDHLVGTDLFRPSISSAAVFLGVPEADATIIPTTKQEMPTNFTTHSSYARKG